MKTACTVLTLVLLLESPAFGQSVAAENTAEPPRPSFRTLFLDMGHDLQALPSRENALVLGTAAALAFAFAKQDVAATRRASGSPRLDILLEPGEMLGGALVQVGGAFATLAAAHLAGTPRLAAVGGDLVRAQSVTAILTQGLKLAAGRTRPDGGRFSFPSGHTSSTFATAAVLHRHFGWKIGAPAYAVAAYVGGSRLQENKHYLSDVVFGAALGIIGGRTVTSGRGKRRISMYPLIAPGTRGVGVSW